jgi:uncharacterized protein with FMN-binding domain
MRRTTAAAVGTLTGAALIMAVRLSVATPVVIAAPPAADLAEAGSTQKPRPTPTAASRGKERKNDNDTGNDEATEPTGDRTDAPANGLRDGKFDGAPASNPYGVVRVSVTIADGQVTNTAVAYPTAGQSASINAGAVPKLKESTLQAQSAEIDAVSGATFTSEAYVTSLQAALDAARG